MTVPALNPNAPFNQVLVSRASESFILHNGAATTSGAGSNCPVGGYNEALLVIDVTAAAGDGATLDLRLEFFDSASGKWFPIPGVSIPQFTAPGQVALAVTGPFGDNIRLYRELGGTAPSFTFTVGFHAKS